MTEWKLEIPAPCDWINANQREHWRTRAEKTAQWRGSARTFAVQAKLPKRLDHVRIVALLHFRDNRDRDAHNFAGTLKAIVDGLVDYGLIKDDSTEFLTGPDIRIGERRRASRGSYAPVGFVSLTITGEGRAQLVPAEGETP